MFIFFAKINRKFDFKKKKKSFICKNTNKLFWLIMRFKLLRNITLEALNLKGIMSHYFYIKMYTKRQPFLHFKFRILHFIFPSPSLLFRLSILTATL
jgi:hypothetical protein